MQVMARRCAKAAAAETGNTGTRQQPVTGSIMCVAWSQRWVAMMTMGMMTMGMMTMGMMTMGMMTMGMMTRVS
jgi:hypothetical protein